MSFLAARPGMSQRAAAQAVGKLVAGDNLRNSGLKSRNNRI
jgi:hypothetical protein